MIGTDREPAGATTRREPLLLLPSQLCLASVWRHQVEALSPLADVHLPDTGRSDSIPSIAADVLAEAPERFSLAAHGMGGFVAFGMLRAAPWRIRRLALIGTLPSAGGPAQVARRERYSALVRRRGG